MGGIWSLADAKGLGKLSLDGHKDAVESVTISADNRYLVTTSQDNTTIVWPMLSLEATDLGEVKPVATLIEGTGTTWPVRPLARALRHPLTRSL